MHSRCFFQAKSIARLFLNQVRTGCKPTHACFLEIIPMWTLVRYHPKVTSYSLATLVHNTQILVPLLSRNWCTHTYKICKGRAIEYSRIGSLSDCSFERVSTCEIEVNTCAILVDLEWWLSKLCHKIENACMDWHVANTSLERCLCKPTVNGAFSVLFNFKKISVTKVVVSFGSKTFKRRLANSVTVRILA